MGENLPRVCSLAAIRRESVVCTTLVTMVTLKKQLHEKSKFINYFKLKLTLSLFLDELLKPLYQRYVYIDPNTDI